MSRVNPSEISAVCAYVAERAGSALSSHQLHRLEAAIATRLGARSQPEYLEFLRSTRGAVELVELMAAISVHKTDLFRDEGQLLAVHEVALKARAATGRPLQVWSAGCATGEEVATLLIMLAEAGASPSSSVLGTDISQTALQAARRLTFAPEPVRRVPEALKARYFRDVKGGHQLDRRLASRARFACHNLMDTPYPLPELGAGFDLIFCRNVLIYFTANAFELVVTRLAERLVPDGVLVLSAAEPLLKPRADLAIVRHTSSFLYVRADGRSAAPPLQPLKPITGEFKVVPAPRPSAPLALGPLGSAELPEELTPEDEALKIFQLVLEWAAAGQAAPQTEAGLRKCLYLAPNLACARYLLGMLLEQRGLREPALLEYRRALATLLDGHARAAPFFLNNDRLRSACEGALKRLAR